MATVTNTQKNEDVLYIWTEKKAARMMTKHSRWDVPASQVVLLPSKTKGLRVYAALIDDVTIQCAVYGNGKNYRVSYQPW